jgi:glucose-6-phosphate 1-dehydrogenase
MSLQPPECQDIVIIGVSGDLASRKLIPALYDLERAELMPDGARVIGMARTELGQDGLVQLAKTSIKQYSRRDIDIDAWERFVRRLCFIRLDEEGYRQAAEVTADHPRLIYLSVPPSAYPGIIGNLAASGLNQNARLVVEKPFGTDLNSSRELSRIIHDAFEEKQIFRIDHYLGKETVQNIIVFRFANAVFERVWNRDSIEHVQMTVAESIGIEGRGSFYEETGAVRDIIQNHVLQVLSLLAMEPPVDMDPEAIRDEKAKVFRAMRPLKPEECVRGQYTQGQVDGTLAHAYREEPEVAGESETETYFAARVEVDSWRWAGVPFLIRTGKRMPLRATEVVIAFRGAPLLMFQGTGMETLRPNHLVLRIQPNEGINLTFLAKQPGPEMTVRHVNMNFFYHESFMTEPAEAYERLLYEVMEGDHTLFAREDSVDLAWQVIQPVLEHPPGLCFYPAGSWGPEEADQLISPHGGWHLK